MLHAIVFDFDGVLADSEPLHFEVFRQVLAETGITLTADAYYARYLGYDDLGAFAAVLRDHGEPSDDARISALMAAKADRFPRLVDGRDVLFPGVKDTVRRFAEDVPLAIASGALPHEINLILEGAGLRDAFQVVVGAGETPRSKPAPDPYVRAIGLLQERSLIPPDLNAASSCVAIEDSKWGILSAKAAGLACIAVTTSYDAAELHDADLVVPQVNRLSLDRIAALVARE
jgi:beta-phosphoglucomutase-like phosphatase (HAD superfamily)